MCCGWWAPLEVCVDCGLLQTARHVAYPPPRPTATLVLQDVQGGPACVHLRFVNRPPKGCHLRTPPRRPPAPLPGAGLMVLAGKLTDCQTGCSLSYLTPCCFFLQLRCCWLVDIRPLSGVVVAFDPMTVVYSPGRGQDACYTYQLMPQSHPLCHAFPTRKKPC